MEVIYSLQAQEVICFLLDQVQDKDQVYLHLPLVLMILDFPKYLRSMDFNKDLTNWEELQLILHHLFFENNAPNFLAQISSLARRSAPASGNLYGLQTATLTPEPLTTFSMKTTTMEKTFITF